MQSDKISVLMSVYKEKESELKESVDSILNQTYSNIEFIIVIDNPEIEWVHTFFKQYNDKRLKIIWNEKNIGLPNSLNKAFKISSGKYIARMDADDISVSSRLEMQIRFLKNNNYDLCGAYMQSFCKGEYQKEIRFPLKPDSIRKIIKVKNCMSHPTWLGKREVFEKLNGYRDVFACEDYDFLLRAIYNNFSIANIDEILLYNRLSESSISKNNPGKQELIASFLRKKYCSGKIATLEEIESFLNSKKFKRKLKKYDFYIGMRIERSKFISKKFPKYYIYTFFLLLNLRFSIPNLYQKLYYNYILANDN